MPQAYISHEIINSSKTGFMDNSVPQLAGNNLRLLSSSCLPYRAQQLFAQPRPYRQHFLSCFVKGFAPSERRKKRHETLVARPVTLRSKPQNEIGQSVSNFSNLQPPKLPNWRNRLVSYWPCQSEEWLGLGQAEERKSNVTGIFRAHILWNNNKILWPTKR